MCGSAAHFSGFHTLIIANMTMLVIFCYLLSHVESRLKGRPSGTTGGHLSLRTRVKSAVLLFFPIEG